MNAYVEKGLLRRMHSTQKFMEKSIYGETIQNFIIKYLYLEIYSHKCNTNTNITTPKINKKIQKKNP